MKQTPASIFHGGQLRQISERFAIPVEQLLDFSASINPMGSPASVLAAIRLGLESPGVLSSYPDLEELELKRCIAAAAHADVNTIAVANGFVPLLEATLRTLSLRNCLLPVPCFGEYRRVLENVGVAVTPYRLNPEDGFRYDQDQLIPALKTGQHDSILLANPQNPTGALCERALLIEIIKTAAQLNVHVLIDEAFIDYAIDQSVADQVSNFPGLTIFRSVTKFHAIPGLRVAYALGNQKHTKHLLRQLPPWPITALASLGVCAALKDTAYASETLAGNTERKRRLGFQLQELGLHVFPGAANFLLLRLPSTVHAEELWQSLIVRNSIVMRDCSTFEMLPSGYLRSAVRADKDNEKLVVALKPLLSLSAIGARSHRGC